MRIIAGQFRGKPLLSLPGKEVRPTLSRNREALFNILSHGRFYGPENSPFIDQNVVDLFCGSGSLGFEALSRGAKHVTFIDENPRALEVVKQNAQRLGVEKSVSYIRSDSTKAPPTRYPCALALLDPPYHSGLAPAAVRNLNTGGWLKAGCIVVIEQAKQEPVEIPDHFSLSDDRTYRNTRVLILERE